MSSPIQQRHLAAIMFTDMVGYSALSQRNETLALSTLDEHNRLLRPLIAEHHGKEIKTVGDAFLVEFASALDATRCAIAMQTAIRDRNSATAAAAGAEPIHIRIGIHLGDVVYRDGDVFGDGVNIAARIESAASADGICVSEDVARQVQNKIDIGLVSLGRGKLKNIELPVDIYAVQLPWLAATRPPTSSRQRSLRTWLIALPVVLLVAGGGGWLLRGSPPSPTTVASSEIAQSIAVLPFVNMSQDNEQTYFSDGLAEEVLNLLARLPQLKVIARTSSFSFRGKEADIATIAKALNVTTVLEGSVRKSADKIRVTAQLIRASDSAHLWSETYERKLTDAFAIQDEIANAVVDALKIKLLPAQRASSANHYVPKPEAFDYYLLGRQLTPSSQRETREKGLAALNKAVEIDPNYGMAYAALAMLESLQSQYSADLQKNAQGKARAFAAIEKAVTLQPPTGDVFATRGYLRFIYQWDWAGADADFTRALQLDANDARIPLKYSLLHAALGRMDMALQSARRATELDPFFSPPWGELARIQASMGDYAGARHSINRRINITQEANSSEAFLMQLAILEGPPAKAKEAILKVSDETTRLWGLAITELELGDSATATRALNAFVAKTPNNYYVHATIYARRGEFDLAFAQLEKLYEMRFTQMVRIRWEPMFAKLRDDPRFDALLIKAGLPPYKKRA